MKTTLAIALLAFALSLCNLTGKRGNTNTNSNSRSSGEIAGGSPEASPGQEPIEKTAEAPPPITSSAPRAGAPGSMPGVNHNSAASDAPPPPKKPTPPPAPKVVSGGVLNGKAISKPQPAYPPIAKAAKASGTVTVQVLVDESGRVVSAHAVSGHPLLQQSAVAAARQARFSPTLLSGQPVKVSGVITYNFVLQ